MNYTWPPPRSRRNESNDEYSICAPPPLYVIKIRVLHTNNHPTITSANTLLKLNLRFICKLSGRVSKTPPKHKQDKGRRRRLPIGIKKRLLPRRLGRPRYGIIRPTVAVKNHGGSWGLPGCSWGSPPRGLRGILRGALPGDHRVGSPLGPRDDSVLS